jgi:hypothetical protein
MVTIGNSSVTDDGLKELQSLKKLRHVMLCDNPMVSDAGLLHITKIKSIEVLTVHGGKITNRGLAALVALDDLSSLSIAPNILEAETRNALQMRFPNLKIVEE